MTFRDYVTEFLRDHGDSTVKQIWEYLPPEGRKEMTRADVDAALECMSDDGLVVRIQRHWRLSWTEYHTRFIRQSDAAALINLYHLARTALAGNRAGRYERMCWAAKWFSKEHPEVTSTGAYKDLDGLLM